MMERIVVVGIPPEAHNELYCRLGYNSPISRAIVVHEADAIFKALIKSGEIKGRCKVLVQFVPNKNVKIDSNERLVKIITVSDGGLVSESDPPYELAMELEYDRDN